MTCLMMMNNNNTNLKILQWNARGLTKSRIQEFKHFLSYSVPSVVLLSETHWNDSFTPKFSSYNVINKNRHERSGGGVAILVHNSIKFSLLPLDNSHSIEMVAISISSATFFSLNFVSVYAPKGNSTKEEILSLFSQTGHLSSVATSMRIILCGSLSPIQIEQATLFGTLLWNYPTLRYSHPLTLAPELIHQLVSLPPLT